MGTNIKRRLTLAAVFAALFAAAVMHGPDGGTGRHRMEEKR
jgi:hypothetical protein